jgi:hypothetical protein
MSPCFTPLVHEIASVSVAPHLTRAVMIVYFIVYSYKMILDIKKR